MNKRAVGTKNEELACEYLTNLGYKILERNFRCKVGEIDIIAIDNNCLVFTEVKFRSTSKYGTSLEAVNPKKQQTIRKVAEYYLLTRYKSSNVFLRFDVIGIDGDSISLIKNAF